MAVQLEFGQSCVKTTRKIQLEFGQSCVKARCVKENNCGSKASAIKIQGTIVMVREGGVKNNTIKVNCCCLS